ncbi:hypothetical protein [Sporosarcina limicola]|uniref:Uncharacterized protein n=1 Tax=Sporosarcina limicola TaxID=34101 RepID=A0A927MSQ0_9BACL|nr:hypothetical protein [Sporosarcina limicola]MBE1556661.1 hypothetical protein [Sporosarcina limicola]
MFISALKDPSSFSMHVRDTNSTSDEAWRKVWGKEAAAINPLAAVNHGRNGLIHEAIRTNDWSDYHQFQAKQHPAWYDKVNGEPKQNKLYYGNMIDVQNRSLQEAIQSGDEKEIAKRKAHLNELISDFKQAPGEVPHVNAFIADPALAREHGISKPSNDWYNSPYNNALVASQGRFEDQHWYDNPYFADHPQELNFAVEAAQEYRPDIAKITAAINRGAYERNVASTSFTSNRAQSIAETVVEETMKNVKEDINRTEDILAKMTVEKPLHSVRDSSNDPFITQAAQIIGQFSSSTIVEQLFKRKDQV